MECMNVTITPTLLHGSVTPPPSTAGRRLAGGIFGGSAAGGSRTAILWLLEGERRWSV